MRFSIIVPIFRIEKYLRQSLDSILNQSYEDFECIMVDDGSDDACPEICDIYAEKDSRFIAVHKKNGGLVSARKAGCAVSRGEYILNVDGDDYIDEHLLETLNELIEQHASDALIFRMYSTSEEQKRSIASNSAEGFYAGEALKNITSRYLVDPNSPKLDGGSILVSICSKCIRRDIYKRCQQRVPNRITNAEDLVFTMALCGEISSLYISDFYGYYYRVVPGSMSREISETHFDNLDLVYEVLGRINYGVITQAQLEAYYFTSAFGHLTKASRLLSYKDYRAHIDRVMTEQRMEKTRKIQMRKMTLSTGLKVFLVKNKLWGTLYLATRLWDKRA